MATLTCPTRLAILMADTPLPQTQKRYQGTYGGVFRHLFTHAAGGSADISSILTLSYHDVVNDLTSYPDLNSIDAILITGSRHNAYANDGWTIRLVEYVQRALATEGRVKVVGVCYGHQIVGRAMGLMPVANEKGWEVSVTGVELSPEGKEFFGLKNMKIQQMHKDILPGLPAGTVPLASTSVCANQGMLYPGRAVTVQGHPEFTEDIMREILELRHSTGLHSDELYESGVRRAGDKHDGYAIARAFLKFLRG